jgi:hypothetical protein
MSDRGAHPIAVLIALGLMAAILAFVVLAAQPPPPKSATAPAGEFSAARAMALLDRLLTADTPHPTGSAANADVAERIRAELTAMGYAVETQETFACRVAWAVCGSVTNIISQFPGATDGPAVLLTAHYDSVPAGPGAADDMAGVAAILETARILRAEAPPRNPVIFLFSDGEEPGLLGAEAFVTRHPWAARIGVVVNLEANGTRGQSVLFETTPHNAWLVETFAAHAPRPVASSVFDTIYTFLPFNTDLTVYEEAGLAGINFAFIEEHPQYHTPLDRPANLSPGSLQHHGDNVLAAARAFAARDLANPPLGRSVYQDVVPGVVLRWPEAWTLGIWLVVAAVWIGVSVVAARRGQLATRPLLWGLLVLPAGVLGATLLGWALGSGVSALTGVATPWYANPLPIRVAIGGAAILWTIVVASFVVRRAGLLGVFLGVWLWWALVAILLAAFAPGISPLVLLPAACAAIPAAVVSVPPFRASQQAWQIAALIALAGASWFWLPFARGSDYAALSADLGPTVGLAVGLAATALAPLVAPPVAYGRLYRPLLLGTFLLIALATVVATRVPPFSESRPARLNILHVQDRQTGEARWALGSEAWSGNAASDALQPLLRAGGFSAARAPVLPWRSQAYWVAPAPPVASQPLVAVLADERVDEVRVIRLRLRSSAAENRLALHVPLEARLRRVDVVGTPYSFASPPAQDGYQAIRCVGAACDGLTLDLHLESEAPPPLFAVETAPGFPPDGQALRAARPDFAAPSGDGDATLLIDRVVLDGS